MNGQELRQQMQECLRKQMNLLAKASEHCKPDVLRSLSEAMVLVSEGVII